MEVPVLEAALRLAMQEEFRRLGQELAELIRAELRLSMAAFAAPIRAGVRKEEEANAGERSPRRRHTAAADAAAAAPSPSRVSLSRASRATRVSTGGGGGFMPIRSFHSAYYAEWILDKEYSGGREDPAEGLGISAMFPQDPRPSGVSSRASGASRPSTARPSTASRCSSASAVGRGFTGETATELRSFSTPRECRSQAPSLNASPVGRSWHPRTVTALNLRGRDPFGVRAAALERGQAAAAGAPDAVQHCSRGVRWEDGSEEERQRNSRVSEEGPAQLADEVESARRCTVASLQLPGACLISEDNPRLSIKRQRTRLADCAVERALGLTPEHPDSHINVSMSMCRRWAERFVFSSYWQCVTIAVICASTLQSGVQTELMARSLLAEAPRACRVADQIFCSYFAVEIALRIFVHRTNFFRMRGWGWNAFDVALVLSQLFEEFLLAVAGSSNITFGLNGLSTSYVMRIARLLRAVRAVRVLHFMRFAVELRLLVGFIVHSGRSFFWAVALLFLLIYVASLTITQVVLLHRIDLPPDDPGSNELAKWFGTLALSMLSLFQGLTGGVDWSVLTNPLIDNITPALGFLFAVYVAFALLAVMNVVTATFIEAVVERAARVNELRKLHDASRAFRSLDVDSSGFITFDEIADHLQDPEVQNFFRSIDVDVAEAQCMFDLLDMSGSGMIEFEEFLSGCIRLQGPAKASDLVLAVKEIKGALQENAASRASVQQAGLTFPGEPAARRVRSTVI